MKLSLLLRLRLGLGKLRRFYLHTLNRSYIRESLARRRGECRRCGTCCRLMFNCPYLRSEPNGLTSCVRHDKRWYNCRIFPVDELDLKERNMISMNGPCGYYFEPKRKVLRWLSFFLAADLFIWAVPKHKAEAWERATVNTVAINPPQVIKAVFRDNRMSSSARVVSGRWRFEESGIECVEDGELAIPLGQEVLSLHEVAARVELWGELNRRGRSETGLAVQWGEALKTGVNVSENDMKVFIELVSPSRRCQELLREAFRMPDWPARASSRTELRGNLRLVVDFDRGRVSTSAAGAKVLLTECFSNNSVRPPRELIVSAGKGAVVHSVMISLRPVRMVEDLVKGDTALLAGRYAEAAEVFGSLAGRTALRPAERAEAAFKQAVALAAGGQTGAVGHLVRATELDPHGIWGERACIALACLALHHGNATDALEMAFRAIRNARGSPEGWELLTAIISEAREVLGRAGSPRTSTLLRRIAEFMEWIGAPPERLRWIWEELARSYEARLWFAEADVLRQKAYRKFPAVRSAALASQGAPSILPEPERHRRERLARSVGSSSNAQGDHR